MVEEGEKMLWERWGVRMACLSRENGGKMKNGLPKKEIYVIINKAYSFTPLMLYYICNNTYDDKMKEKEGTSSWCLRLSL